MPKLTCDFFREDKKQKLDSDIFWKVQIILFLHKQIFFLRNVVFIREYWLKKFII